MSHLLNKSNSNKETALYLYKQSPRPCYPTIVHCSYYSCIQKIMYILKDFFNNAYKKMNTTIKGGKGNTHKEYFYAIGEIIKDISRAGHQEKKNDVKQIRFYLKQLFLLRLDADYEDVEILEKQAKKAYQYAEDFHKIIKKHLQL